MIYKQILINAINVTPTSRRAFILGKGLTGMFIALFSSIAVLLITGFHTVYNRWSSLLCPYFDYSYRTTTYCYSGSNMVLFCSFKRFLTHSQSLVVFKKNTKKKIINKKYSHLKRISLPVPGAVEMGFYNNQKINLFFLIRFSKFNIIFNSIRI